MGDITVEDVAAVHVSDRAIENFRFHHGGGHLEADAQLRSMLEDFLLKSSRRASPEGYLRLARGGYAVVLSPDRGTVVAYSTVHRERTWAQVKAGVQSRIAGPRRGPGRAEAPEPGPPVELGEFRTALCPDEIFLTARVRRSYAKLASMQASTDDDLDRAIRDEVAQFASAIIGQRDDGIFEVQAGSKIWLVAPDLRSLIGVKRSHEEF
ncbi:hypothetical protein [Kribbella swartbergensis]